MAYKKVIIKKADLPPAGATNDYLVRFRVVSEDRNRFSAWSQLYLVDGPNLVSVPGSANFGSSTISLVWGDENNRPYYDVFVTYGVDGVWQDGDWTDGYIYHGTTPIHTYSFLVPSTVKIGGVDTVPNKFKFLIQVEGTVKQLAPALEIYPGYAAYPAGHVAETVFDIP